MKGTLMQLVSYGAENIHLTYNPEISFFMKVYNRHTNFSMESIVQTFVDNPGFNKMSFVTIKKDADLISSMYLEVILPYDITLTNTYWTNRIGFNLINKIELYIGKKLIDRLYGLWSHIWTELTHTIDKKHILDQIVGTKGNDGISDGLNASSPHKLIIPLLFSFCRNKGLSIPICAIRDNQDITLKIFFQSKKNCIQSGPIPSGDLEYVNLWVDYIYLDNQEKTNIIQKPIEYLIEVTQHSKRNLISSGVKTLNLPFTLPCKELAWVVQNNNLNGDSFTDFTYNNSSMVNSVQFKFNSKNVFSSGFRNNNYFNYIVPYSCHTGSPDLGINAYSFALYPEKLEPSGFINFSHLNSCTINLNTNGNGVVDVFALSYNILRVENGSAKLIYNF